MFKGEQIIGVIINKILSIKDNSETYNSKCNKPAKNKNILL